MGDCSFWLFKISRCIYLVVIPNMSSSAIMDLHALVLLHIAIVSNFVATLKPKDFKCIELAINLPPLQQNACQRLCIRIAFCEMYKNVK